MTDVEPRLLADLALEAISLGYAVVPPAEDGTKKPMGEWKRFQTELPTEADIHRWYANGRHGIGIVTGKVSGNLEMLEFEGRAVADGLDLDFIKAAEQAGLTELVERVIGGYLERTPTDGIHILYRVDGEVAGNTKLARRPANVDELERNPVERIKVLIETRGEGGFVIVAPTDGPVHPTGLSWQIVTGGLASVATINPAERDELHRLARSFDQMPAPLPLPPATPRDPLDGNRPGDDYNQQPDAPQAALALLQHHGWTPVFQRPHNGHTDIHLRRPGKTIGTSAVLHMDAGVLYVFSSSTLFEPEQSYSPLAILTTLEHGDDYQAAARTLRPTPTRDNLDWAQIAASPSTTAAATTQVVEEITARPFTTVDLAPYLAAGPTEPAYVPGPYRWLYAGRLTAIQAEPGVGKTWLSLWLALHAITAGTDVVYVDEEGGPELITERLLALNADPVAVARHLIYVPFPGRAWDLADQAGFDQLLGEHPNAALAVFDSLPDFLALAGRSEDSAQDVTWWMDRVCGICRQHGIAQVVLDHLVKPDPSQQNQTRTRSRYARGSGAKLAKVDATFLVETAVAFDAHTSGRLKLWKTKDRRGRISLPDVHQSPVLIDINVDDQKLTLGVRDPEPDKPTGQRHFRPTGLMEKLSDSLVSFNERGIKPTRNVLMDAVKAKKEHRLDALRCLIDEGYVTIEAGPNRSIAHLLVKPYRQLTDPHSDSYMTIPGDPE